MKSIVRAIVNLGLFVLVVGGGGLLAIEIGKPHTTPRYEGNVSLAPLVRGLEIVKGTFDVPLEAFGSARAPKVFALRSQVAGKILEVSASLQEGSIVEEGEILIEIDTKEIGYSIAEAEAKLLRTQASIDQVRANVVPIEIEIERLGHDLASQQKAFAMQEEAVAMAQGEVDRVEDLGRRGAASQVAREAAQKNLNAQRQALLIPQGRITQIPLQVEGQKAQKAALLAQIPVLEADRVLAQSHIDLLNLRRERAVLRSPVRGLVLFKDPTTGFATKPPLANDVIGVGRDLGWVRPIDDSMVIRVSIEVEEALHIRGVGVEREIAEIDPDRFPPIRVEWYSNPEYFWEGRIDRWLREIDVATRLTSFILEVEEVHSEPEEGLPTILVPGMYCRIVIPGEVLEDVIAIPRSALREGNRVLVADPEGILEFRNLVTARITEDRVVVASGLEEGEVLVLTDLPQAVSGMKVRVDLR